MTDDWAFTSELNLEGRPTGQQQERVEDFLTELRHLSARYGLLIDSYVEAEERPAVRDIYTGTVVGLALAYFVDPMKPTSITGYDFMGASILDGAWPVEGPDGTVQLREVDGRAQRARKGIPRRS